MTDTFAKTARPATAAIAWAAKDGIYVEYPTKAGPPYITRFPKTADGLCRALNILIENSAPETRTVTAAHPAISKATAKFSDEAKASAAEIVRRMLK